METIIKCSNLTHYYGSRKIYEDLNFEVPKGRILGLLGKNGTGKTTTINILMGYLKPRSGECRIFGEDIQRMQPVTRERIALLIENHVQYTFMNIEQIERFYSAFYPKWNKEAYYELMRKLKVAPKQKISPHVMRTKIAGGTGPHSRPKRRFTGTRRFLDRTRPRLPPTLHRVSARIRQSRRKDHLPYLAHHTGHGTAGRRLYHHGLRPHTDSEACKGIARHLHTLYLQNIVARQAPHDPSLYSTAAIRDSAETYSFENEEHIKQILQEQSIPYTDFKSEKMNLEDVFIGLTGKY